MSTRQPFFIPCPGFRRISTNRSGRRRGALPSRGSGRAAAGLDESETFPADIYAEMAGLGLFGITVPDTYGGAGLDALSYALVMEELSRGYASVADQCGLVELIGTLLVRTRNRCAAQASGWVDVLAAQDPRCLLHHRG